ncbi:MAG: hypothetical protein V3W50_06300 [Thermoanaerobaculia bacterium]
MVGALDGRNNPTAPPRNHLQKFAVIVELKVDAVSGETGFEPRRKPWSQLHSHAGRSEQHDIRIVGPACRVQNRKVGHHSVWLQPRIIGDKNLVGTVRQESADKPFYLVTEQQSADPATGLTHKPSRLAEKLEPHIVKHTTSLLRNDPHLLAYHHRIPS